MMLKTDTILKTSVLHIIRGFQFIFFYFLNDRKNAKTLLTRTVRVFQKIQKYRLAFHFKLTKNLSTANISQIHP